MARRIINKVGGAGNDVASFGPLVGPDVQRISSVLKLSFNDVRSDTRQVFEKRLHGTHGSKIQMSHPPRSDSVEHEENSGNIKFVNIDGDGSAKLEGATQSKLTAYKMKSFMSSMELGPRGNPRSSNQVNQNRVKTLPPRREPESPKAFRQEDPTRNSKMSFPIGINQTNQPYVVPKFMPSYREMMRPKPKPGPLVSIVESTPPSMQKWAIEWNADPKQTISIDELKEDLIREADEKSHRPQNGSQRMPMNGSDPDEEHDDGITDQRNNDVISPSHSNQHDNQLQSHTNYTEAKEKPNPNVSDSAISPWKDLIPTSYEMEIQQPREPQKIGGPLVDWVPPKCSHDKKSPYSRQQPEYSFQEAINNGTQAKTGMLDSSNRLDVFVPKNIENGVSFDTDQQKFHDWFKEKMSSAVQTTMKQPKSTLGNDLQSQALQWSKNSVFADPGKPGAAGPPGNPRGEHTLAETASYHSEHTNKNNEEKHRKQTGYHDEHIIRKSNHGKQWKGAADEITNFKQNNSGNDWKDAGNHAKQLNQKSGGKAQELGMIQPKVQNHPKLTKNLVSVMHEPEKNSSFYQWLKSRGRHMAKSEPEPKANKKENKKTEQNRQSELQNPLFPWSVSYASLKKKISTPKMIPKRPQVFPQKFDKSLKTDVKYEKTVLHDSKPRKTVSLVDNNVRNVKSSKNSMNRPTKMCLQNTGKTSHKTLEKRSSKRASKKQMNTGSGVYVKYNKNKKTPKSEYLQQQPVAVASAEHLWQNNVGKLGSETDHVNNVRKMDIFGHSPNGVDAKKLFPLLTGSQMKYWESKYIMNPSSFQNQRLQQSVEGQVKSASPFDWFRAGMANGDKNASKDVSEVKPADGAAGRADSIDGSSKFPLKVSQNSQNQAMDFLADLDAYKFLLEEAVEEKKILESTGGHQENKVQADKDKMGEEQETQKGKGKERIKFSRAVKAQTVASARAEAENDTDLSQRVRQKLQEDDFVLALGEDPATEDTEWSEFISPRNGFDRDSDLNALIDCQAHQLSST